MRLEEDPEGGDLEAAGGGASREGDGTWKVTLFQVMPPMDKRVTAMEAPL